MKDLTIFFATDVHGSDKCFGKFLNAAKFYGADVLILGGDMTGKALIPLVKQADGSYRSQSLGALHHVKTEEEIRTLEKSIADAGYYPFRTDERELEQLDTDKAKVTALFSRLVMERLEKWIKLTDERLANTDMICHVCPGNDDNFEIDPVLDKSDHMLRTEGKVVMIGRTHEMISTGFSNITPWKCPRDIPDEKLGQKIEAMASQVKDMDRCIFNIHCPPYDTPLDKAPRLNQEQKIVFGPDGRPEITSVGSESVRRSIERYRPLLGLHGHIHESKGVTKLGQTICVNPGSEYQEGILRGALVKLKIDEKKVRSYLLVSG